MGHYLRVQKYLLLVLKILSCFFRKKLFSQVFVSFASMSNNPDTGIKIHILVLNFRIQHPRNSEPLKYPSLGHKRSKI